MITYSRDLYKILYRYDVNTWNMEEVIPNVIKYKSTAMRRKWFLEIRDSIDCWAEALFDLPEGIDATLFTIPRAFKYGSWVELGCAEMKEKELIRLLEKIFKLGAFI